jgi:hypothetical protein
LILSKVGLPSSWTSFATVNQVPFSAALPDDSVVGEPPGVPLLHAVRVRAAAAARPRAVKIRDFRMCCSPL